MTCHETLGGIPGALACDRADDHATGHTFTASWMPDRHDTSEAVQS
jgi:hypothetical protein